MRPVLASIVIPAVAVIVVGDALSFYGGIHGCRAGRAVKRASVPEQKQRDNQQGANAPPRASRMTSSEDHVGMIG